jgi:PAS domain S-box-containing protein
VDISPLTYTRADAWPTEQLLAGQKTALELVVQGAPLGEVLTHLVRIVESLSNDQSVATILLLDQGKLQTGAAPSLPEHFKRAIDGLTPSLTAGCCGVAAVTGQVANSSNIAADPKWASLRELPLSLGLVACWCQPIQARDGRILGAFGTFFRTCREPTMLERQLVAVLSHTAAIAIERKLAEDQAAEQRHVLDRALDAAEMGTWRYTVDDHICYFDLRAQRLYGLTEARFVHDAEGVQKIFHPDDLEPMWTAVQKAIEVDGRYGVDYRVKRPGGGWRWLSAEGLVEFAEQDGHRVPVSIVGASHDITVRKEAEAQQQLLVDELSHRVRNTLAIIQSIAAQTLRETPDPAAFKKAFTERLSALSRAHGLLTNALGNGATHTDLCNTTLSPFSRSAGRAAIQVHGPAATVTPNVAVTLCLMIHELATNAAKYGALSVPNGRVVLEWHESAWQPGDIARTYIELHWIESGGPEVKPPPRQGFGSRLIEATAEQVRGEGSLDFKPEGLRYHLRFPTG